MEKTLFIDSHAHLGDSRFDEDRAEVIERARQAGLKRIIDVGCWSDEGGFSDVVALMKEYDFIYGALGVHPHDAAKVDVSAAFSRIKALALGPGGEARGGKVVAIGETGLDYHYDNSPRSAQQDVFRRHLVLARELNLPVVVHTREAWADTVRILEDEGFGEGEDGEGVFHCFSGGPEEARKALEMGFYISISGVVTFKGAENVREAVKATPTESLLIETDCPYLAPAPKRGRRNEPAFVVETARAIAELKGLSIEDVARITTLNAENVFGLGGPEKARIAYRIRNSLYLNITNRCTNRCTFCAKFKSYTVKGHFLRLNEEPGFREIIDAIGGTPEKYDEIVFCGYGEPLIRIELVKKVGLFLKRMGCRIRIDTDGLANLVHGRNVLPELMFVDTISVSLNAPDSKTYQELVKTPFGEAAFPAILFFLREAKKYIPRVVASVVAVPGLDIEACRRVAVEDAGVEFRVREYNEVG